jgi:hypothetical protein
MESEDQVLMFKLGSQRYTHNPFTPLKITVERVKIPRTAELDTHRARDGKK